MGLSGLLHKDGEAQAFGFKISGFEVRRTVPTVAR